MRPWIPSDVPRNYSNIKRIANDERVKLCFEGCKGSSGFGAALFGGGNDVGHDENIVFATEVASGRSKDSFGADVEFAIAGEGLADVVFAEELGDFDRWRKRMGGHGGDRSGWHRRSGLRG